MFCSNCGNKNDDNTKFCTSCGKELQNLSTNEVKTEPQQQAYQQAPMQQQPQMQYQQGYQQPYYPMPRKKSHAGLWVFLIILLAVIGGGLYFLSTISLFGPKDLKAEYTKADFNNLMENKLGIEIISNIYPNSEDLDINDYNWNFSDYERKTIKITPTEVTAFFNEIAPPFWFFKNTQVKIDENGKIITSSSADLSKIINTLFPDVADMIPIPLPKKANIYTEGDFSITNNHINMDPEVFKVGPVGLPDQYKSDENVEIFSSYLDRFIEFIPGLDIKEARLGTDGNFIFDAIVPTKVEVTTKGY